MRQILFTIPGLNFPLYSFGVMVAVALSSAMFLATWRAKRVHLPAELFYDLAFWMILAGIIGARAVYVLEHPEAIQRPADLLKIWQGGIVFYGCVIGGFIAIFSYYFLRPFPLLPALDVVAPSTALAMGIGRLGCFLNGCCYGGLCDLRWLAVQFPAQTLPWADQVRLGLIPISASRSLPVHPTQLYLLLDGLLLFALLSFYFPIRRRDGEVMALLLITYPITRFLIELLRSDEPALWLGLTLSQMISVGLLAIGVSFWIYLSSRPAGRYADQFVAEEALVASRS